MLREDDKDVAPHVAKFVAVINQTLVHTRSRVPQNIRSHPPKVYRGGGMPHKHLEFFAVGKKYRVAGFLATSLKKDTAREFMQRENQFHGEPCVLWIINIDRNCLHVSYVEKTHVNTEEEYLFAPYSPFKVVNVSYVCYFLIINSIVCLGHRTHATHLRLVQSICKT